MHFMVTTWRQKVYSRLYLEYQDGKRYLNEFLVLEYKFKKKKIVYINIKNILACALQSCYCKT